MNGDLWYFAYGSNLNTKQLVDRINSIPKARRCRLPDYRLEFNKLSIKGGVRANIIPSPHDETWGAIFLFGSTDFDTMDRHEGVPDGHYRHERVTVICDDHVPVEALTYVAGRQFVVEPAPPPSWYLNLIIEGAKQFNLPADYIAKIEARSSEL